MIVAITGATGTIGRKLADTLTEQGHTVIAVSRSHKKDFLSNQKNAIHKYADLTQGASLYDAIRGADVVFHLAALTHSNDSKEYHAVNVIGTKKLVEACTKAGTNRIFFMSSRAADLKGGGYSTSKFEAEQIIRSSGLIWTIIRPSEVYGSGNDYIQKVITIIRYLYVIPIFGDGTYTVNPVHCDDVVAALSSMFTTEDAQYKTYTLAGPDEMTFNNFVASVIHDLHLKRRVIHVPWWTLAAFVRFCAVTGIGTIAADQLPRLLMKKSNDIREAEIDLGYRPRPLNKGLRDLI